MSASNRLILFKNPEKFHETSDVSQLSKIVDHYILLKVRPFNLIIKCLIKFNLNKYFELNNIQ